MGAHIMAEAGYDPIQLARFFVRLNDQSGAFVFLSDHPNPGDRSRAIKAEAAQLPYRNYAYQTGHFQEMKKAVANIHEPPPKPQAEENSGPSATQSIEACASDILPLHSIMTGERQSSLLRGGSIVLIVFLLAGGLIFAQDAPQPQPAPKLPAPQNPLRLRQPLRHRHHPRRRSSSSFLRTLCAIFMKVRCSSARETAKTPSPSTRTQLKSMPTILRRTTIWDGFTWTTRAMPKPSQNSRPPSPCGPRSQCPQQSGAGAEAQSQSQRCDRRISGGSAPQSENGQRAK